MGHVGQDANACVELARGAIGAYDGMLKSRSSIRSGREFRHPTRVRVPANAHAGEFRKKKKPRLVCRPRREICKAAFLTNSSLEFPRSIPPSCRDRRRDASAQHRSCARLVGAPPSRTPYISVYFATRARAFDPPIRVDPFASTRAFASTHSPRPGHSPSTRAFASTLAFAHDPPIRRRPRSLRTSEPACQACLDSWQPICYTKKDSLWYFCPVPTISIAPAPHPTWARRSNF